MVQWPVTSGRPTAIYLFLYEGRLDWGVATAGLKSGVDNRRTRVG